jgi:glycyl-tRNA synthetase beta chain
VKILSDLPELTGIDSRLRIGPLIERATIPFAQIAKIGAGSDQDSSVPLLAFISDRLAYLLEQRGFDVRAVRAVLHGGIAQVSPLEARRKLEALSRMSGSEALIGVATLLKRVKNISKGIPAPTSLADLDGALSEPAERALLSSLGTNAKSIQDAASRGDYREAFGSIASLQPAVATFFDEVLVMAEDERVRTARLRLVASLRDLILDIADISEIVE